MDKAKGGIEDLKDKYEESDLDEFVDKAKDSASDAAGKAKHAADDLVDKAKDFFNKK